MHVWGFLDFDLLYFRELVRLVSLCFCQAVSTKRVAGENKTERLTLPGRTLLHSCCLSVYPGPMWRTTEPPENRLQPPPRPLPCLAGFLIIIWDQASLPSLHSTLLFQRATYTSVWREGAIHHQRREKLKIWARGFGWTLFFWDFVWTYFYVHIQKEYNRESHLCVKKKLSQSMSGTFNSHAWLRITTLSSALLLWQLFEFRRGNALYHELTSRLFWLYSLLQLC